MGFMALESLFKGCQYSDIAPKTAGHEKTHGDFIFRAKYLDRMQKHTVLLHPLPKRDEIEVEVDYVDDPRVVYWRQERNGMWMRVAILAKLFAVDKLIMERNG